MWLLPQREIAVMELTFTDRWALSMWSHLVYVLCYWWNYHQYIIRINFHSSSYAKAPFLGSARISLNNCEGVKFIWQLDSVIYSILLYPILGITNDYQYYEWSISINQNATDQQPLNFVLHQHILQDIHSNVSWLIIPKYTQVYLE